MSSWLTYHGNMTQSQIIEPAPTVSADTLSDHSGAAVLVRIHTDVDTCDLCCRPARRAARIRTPDGWEINAAGKCARYLLGYDPFAVKS